MGFHGPLSSKGHICKSQVHLSGRLHPTFAHSAANGHFPGMPTASVCEAWVVPVCLFVLLRNSAAAPPFIFSLDSEQRDPGLGHSKILCSAVLIILPSETGWLNSEVCRSRAA